MNQFVNKELIPYPSSLFLAVKILLELEYKVLTVVMNGHHTAGEVHVHILFYWCLSEGHNKIDLMNAPIEVEDEDNEQTNRKPGDAQVRLRLGPIVCVVQLTEWPVDSESFREFSVVQTVKFMFIALVRVDCILLLIIPSAKTLSVWINVADCLWPIFSRMIPIYTAALAMMLSSASSSSVDEDMTCLMMCAMLRRDPSSMDNEP